MTIEEKRQAIKEYCTKRGPCVVSEEFGLTEDCPLLQTPDACFETGTDDIINRNYDILFPSEKSEDTEKADDPVNHPSHYTHGKECIDEMLLLFGKDAVMNFCLCNAWKYRKRALYKNGEEDMAKSDWYIQKYCDIKYG